MSNPYLPLMNFYNGPGSIPPGAGVNPITLEPFGMALVPQGGVPAIPGVPSFPGAVAGPGIPMGPTINQLALGPGQSNLPALYQQIANPNQYGYAGLAGDIPPPTGATAGGAATAGADAAATAGSAASSGGRFALAEGLGLRGIATRALPYALAGQVATAGLNHFLPSTGSAGNVRQVLGDAATWAGIGAGVGSVVPGIGTAAGGIAGGTAGALYALADTLFGDSEPSKDDYRSTIATAAAQLGLNPSEYTAAFDLLSKAGGDPKQLSLQLASQVLQDAKQAKFDQQAQQMQVQQRDADQRFALALQAQAQEFFTPYTNNIISAGQAQADLLSSLADSLPGPYRNVMKTQAAQAMSQSQRLAGAYAAQSALIPGQFMAQAELKRQQQLQQLQYQQAVIQAQQSKSQYGSGVAGLNQQLAQQVPATAGG